MSYAPKCHARSYKPEEVLGLLGSLWTHYYGGKGPLLTVVRANLEMYSQMIRNFDEAVSCMSRFSVPLYHTERRVLLELRREDQSGFSFPKPPGLESLPLILNRMTDATLVLQEGIDYCIRDRSIEFVVNPFDNELISQDADAAYLWGVNGQFDHEYVYKHFGYIHQVRRTSDQPCEAYRRTVNAIADCVVGGTTMAGLEALLAAILDVPVADGEETVLMSATDRRGRFLATTRNIYRIASDAILGPPVGSQPRAGAPLVEAFKISEFRPKQLPDGVTDVIVPAGMAGGELQVPARSLDMVSCILVQLRNLDQMDELTAHIRRVLPPQTGVVYAPMAPATQRE